MRSDGMDGYRLPGGIGEFPTALSQALLTDEGGDRCAVLLEDAVQVARRDEVRGGDVGGFQVGIVEVRVDEVGDLLGQCPLRGLGR